MSTIDERITRQEERLSALTGSVSDMRRTVEEHRHRLESLESRDGTVKALADTIQQLPTQMQTIARDAAQQALTASTRERQNLVGLRAQIGSVLVGAAGIGMMIATAVTSR